MHRQIIAAIHHKQLHGCTGGPRRPGQSFAIEHREQQKKSEVRPFLGEGVVEDPKQFVPFVLVFSGRLGREAKAFLVVIPAAGLGSALALPIMGKGKAEPP